MSKSGHLSKRKFRRLILTAGIALFLFVGVSSLLFQKYTSQRVGLKSITEITNNWQLYTGDGISFHYPSHWLIESPEETVFDDEKTWKISRNDEGHRATFILIRRVRNYDPLPGSSDVLRSYASEWSNTLSHGQQVQDIVLQGRKAIRIRDDKEWVTDTVVVSIPESSELLLISYSESSFDKTVDVYFDPFLESLVISPTAWPKPGTYLSLVPNENTITTDWIKFQTMNYTILHPNSWTTGYEDVNGTQSLVLTKKSGEKKQELGFQGMEIPEIIIGSPEVFSTSGALCGNGISGECEEIGQVDIQVKEKTYSAPIIKKRERKNGYLSESFYYVFRLNLNRIPTPPSNTVTAIYKNESDGQEIVNILSTISY